MNHSFLGVDAIPPLSPSAFVACSGTAFYMPVVQALYSPKIHNLKHKNIILSNLKYFGIWYLLLQNVVIVLMNEC
jgi:hypothetical protein